MDDKVTCCEGTRQRKLRRNRSLLKEVVRCRSTVLLKGLGLWLHILACSSIPCPVGVPTVA